MARAKRGRRKWSVERVVEDLRRIQRAGKLRITATALINSGYTGLASAIHKYVGSFDRARRVAGIPHPGRLSSERKKWDEDVVIGELRHRHREREPLASKEVPSKLRDAIFYCGSYQNAIEMAGLDYAKIRRSSPAWTRAALIAALQRGAKSKKTGVGNDGPVPPSVWLAPVASSALSPRRSKPRDSTGTRCSARSSYMIASSGEGFATRSRRIPR